MNPFFAMINKRWSDGARVCVGLDAAIKYIPARFNPRENRHAQLDFCAEIAEATKDFALAYKLQVASYQSRQGFFMLTRIVEMIRAVAPGIPIILDGKYADVKHTNASYAHAAFELIKADAVTVNPYVGELALAPFVTYKNKGIFVVCRTSDEGADEVQNIKTIIENGDELAGTVMPLYLNIARRVSTRWNGDGNCALVVGATAPKELQRVRSMVGDMTILSPGFGAQGANVELAVLNGINSKGSGFIASSSREIVFADDPRAATVTLTEKINVVLAKVQKEGEEIS